MSHLGNCVFSTYVYSFGDNLPIGLLTLSSKVVRHKLNTAYTKRFEWLKKISTHLTPLKSS